jgi:UDP-N-acetylglucosamine transferase subunit ALG13
VSDSRTPEVVAQHIVVTVGTDHHPFDRLVTWVNGWLESRPEHASNFFVQSGAASVVPACRSARFLDAEQLDAELDQAHLMICHGGPGAIADAWDRGHVPIVVPRLRRLGEVVDDHQIDFCEKLDEIGRVRLARTPAVFGQLIDEGISDSRPFRPDSSGADVEATVARFAVLVDELVGRPRRRLLGRHAPASRPQAKDPNQDAGGSRAQLVRPLLKVTVKH